MTSHGINRHTGKVLSGWEHTVQSLGVIFTTGLGERIMRRFFGSAVRGLLGKNLTPETLARFYLAIAIAIDLWEPRFRLVAVSYPNNTNSEQRMRQGRLGLKLVGEYRPRALEGDFTVEGPERTVTI